MFKISFDFFKDLNGLSYAETLDHPLHWVAVALAVIAATLTMTQWIKQLFRRKQSITALYATIGSDVSGFKRGLREIKDNPYLSKEFAQKIEALYGSNEQ